MSRYIYALRLLQSCGKRMVFLLDRYDDVVSQRNWETVALSPFAGSARSTPTLG